MSEDSTDKPLSLCIRRRLALEKLMKESDSARPELSPEEQQVVDKFVQIARNAAQRVVKDIERRDSNKDADATNC